MRAALDAAIEQLKASKDVEEPPDAARLEQLHSDAGREGVAGSPDLARAIMRKIAMAAVVIADVTPVGTGPARKDAEGKETSPKALMNPNVAIELGYALGKHSTDETNNLLMVLNTYYGDRQSLPFDLAHKAGPIEYKLAPTATREEMLAAHNKLRGDFVIALRPFLKTGPAATSPTTFQEVQTTINNACFWQPGETLASIVANPLARFMPDESEERLNYNFDANCIFYLRLIPTKPRSTPLKNTELETIAKRRPQILTRTTNGGFGERNFYGAISYGQEGNSENLEGFTQLFPNGEIWGVTRIFVRKYEGYLVIPTVSVEKIYQRVLPNYIEIATDHFKLPPPHQIEIGAVGLQDKRLEYDSNRNAVSGPIYKPELKIRQTLNDVSIDSQNKLITTFIDALLDLAGVTIE